MKCKFCQAELEESVPLCPACGQENCQEEVAEEAPAKKKLSSGKLAVIYICVIALLAALIAPIIIGMKPSSKPSGSAVGTVPADGNKDDVTCQGSYTVSDKKVQSKVDTVVATAGDEKLTNEMLQSIYWMQVYNFLSNYGTNSLDTSKPLDAKVTLLHKAEELLMQEMPVIPVVFNKNATVGTSDLKGVKSDYYVSYKFTGASLKNYEDYLVDFQKVFEMDAE